METQLPKLAFGLVFKVSVPLRGLDMWKLKYCLEKGVAHSFSPLAGIRYVETRKLKTQMLLKKSSFSPLAGIRYVETMEVIEVTY